MGVGFFGRRGVPAWIFFLAALPLADSVEAQTPPSATVVVSLVRKDFSDCQNHDVNDRGTGGPGSATVVRDSDGTTAVTVALRGTPNTTYVVNLKCVTVNIGSVRTDANGLGSATMRFQTSSVGSLYAFDIYPNGAPAGNKFQSVTVDFSKPWAGSWKLNRVLNNYRSPVSLAAPLANGGTADAHFAGQLQNFGVAIPGYGVASVEYKGAVPCSHPHWRARLSMGERAWDFLFDTGAGLDIVVGADGAPQFAAGDGSGQVVVAGQPFTCRGTGS